MDESSLAEVLGNLAKEWDYLDTSNAFSRFSNPPSLTTRNNDATSAPSAATELKSRADQLKARAEEMDAVALEARELENRNVFPQNLVFTLIAWADSQVKGQDFNGIWVAAPPNTNKKRQLSGPPSAAYFNVINYATQILAVEVVGSVPTNADLDFLCNKFNLTDMTIIGLNATLFHEIVCENDKEPLVPPPASAVHAQLTTLSSDLWVQQALGAMAGNLTVLCNIFNVDQANSIGLAGSSVRSTICSAATGGPVNLPGASAIGPLETTKARPRNEGYEGKQT